MRVCTQLAKHCISQHYVLPSYNPATTPFTPLVMGVLKPVFPDDTGQTGACRTE